MSENDVLMPSYEEFMEKLYSLNPVGNAFMYYDLLKEHLGTLLYVGKTLTFEMLVKRYSDYMIYLKPYNDIKDKQFIKKDKTIKSVGEYLMNKLYNDDYSTLSSSPNDNYLFGI